MELRVNGQRYVTGSTPLLFTYSRPSTPIVLETIPESLSFALTNNITVVGFNFGLLKREVQVMFGNRTCKIWDVNQTHINCQLKRSAMALPPLCTANRDIYNEDCVVKPHNFFQKPTLLVTSRGYGVSRNSSFLDTRFEIHNVEPKVGSEEGGALVTVTGVGFGNKQLTPQLTIAALGTLGDVVSWSDTQVVFTTRKLTLNVAKVDLMVNLISAKHKCGSGPDPHPVRDAQMMDERKEPPGRCEATTFVEMEDRVMERLFGFCMPYSLKCSLTPDGLRVLGTLPPGFSGPGPLDAVPMFYTPTPVMPMVLPLEFRTDLAEAGWQQAPYECILESVRAISVLTNARIIFVGTWLSETTEEGVFLVPRGSVGCSIGSVMQLGSVASAGDPQVHIYKVRRSGVFLTPPGAGIVMPDETYATTNADAFLPEALGTQERRALQKIDVLAQLVADPAAELVYSCETRGNRGPLLLRYMGSPAVLPLFGYLVSDIEKRSPAMFQPTNATARYKESAKPEPESLLAVQPTPEERTEMDGESLTPAELAAAEVEAGEVKGKGKGHVGTPVADASSNTNDAERKRSLFRDEVAWTEIAYKMSCEDDLREVVNMRNRRRVPTIREHNAVRAVTGPTVCAVSFERHLDLRKTEAKASWKKVITSEDCEHRAFRAYVTPNVTEVSALSGNDGDTITFTVSMPDGYIAAVSNASVSVHLGPYVCPHTVDSKSGNTLTISCTVPAFEASTVMIKVRILPLGYARMGDGLEKFTSGALREVFWRHLMSYDPYVIYSVKNSKNRLQQFAP
eukprot:symbB.v1.2.009029.t1/scaffold568.1/size186168/5